MLITTTTSTNSPISTGTDVDGEKTWRHFEQVGPLQNQQSFFAVTSQMHREHNRPSLPSSHCFSNNFVSAMLPTAIDEELISMPRQLDLSLKLWIVVTRHDSVSSVMFEYGLLLCGVDVGTASVRDRWDVIEDHRVEMIEESEDGD